MSISTSNRHCVSSRSAVSTRTISALGTISVSSPSPMVRSRMAPGSFASIWLDNSSSVIAKLPEIGNRQSAIGTLLAVLVSLKGAYEAVEHFPDDFALIQHRLGTFCTSHAHPCCQHEVGLQLFE